MQWLLGGWEGQHVYSTGLHRRSSSDAAAPSKAHGPAVEVAARPVASNLRTATTTTSERLALGAIVAWATAVYLATSWGLPARLLKLVGIDPGHPVLWQLASALVWCSLTAGAFAGWRRHVHEEERLSKAVVALAVLAAAFHVALLIMAGLFVGFGESPYSHQIMPMLGNLAYVLSVLVAIEMSRACVVRVMARRSPTAALITATTIFAMLSLPLAKLTSAGGPQSLLTLLGGDALPALSQGLLASFFALVAGPLAAIAYRGFLLGFEWLSPILPNLAWPVAAFVGTIGPIIGLHIIRQPLAGETPNAADREDTEMPKARGWIPVLVTSVTILWFVTGLFGVQPAIISGPSMNPTLEVGDMVIVRDFAPEELEVGDVVRYQMGGMWVIHRVVEIEAGGGRPVFVTRGDNNNVDDDPVLSQQMDGKVVLTLPKLGWPSIWIRQLIEAAT